LCESAASTSFAATLKGLAHLARGKLDCDCSDTATPKVQMQDLPTLEVDLGRTNNDSDFSFAVFESIPKNKQ